MSINISELIWTVICFFVLLVVLKKLLFDPLVSFMAARDARIQDGISAGRTAQQQLDAAAQARSDAPRRQSAAADALLAEAKSASERKRAQTLQAAHQEAAQAMRDVRAHVRSEETAAAAAVESAGFDPYERKLLGVTAMQKLIGKTRFEELLSPYIEKPQGKPTLVPESDKRPAMNTAKSDFMEE